MVKAGKWVPYYRMKEKNKDVGRSNRNVMKIASNNVKKKGVKLDEAWHFYSQNKVEVIIPEWTGCITGTFSSMTQWDKNRKGKTKKKKKTCKVYKIE